MATVGFAEPRVAWAFVFFVVVGLIQQSSAFAGQSVTLAWQPSDDPNIAGYRVYYGVASGNYTTMIPVGNSASATISGLREGSTYYFVVTAYDASGLESAFSNEVSYSVPPVALSLGRIWTGGLSRAIPISSAGATPSAWVLEASPDLKTWKTLSVGTNSAADVVVVVAPASTILFRLNSNVPGVRLSAQNNQPGGFPNSFCMSATGTVPGPWILEASTDFKSWRSVVSGTNSPVNAAVMVSTAPAMFFRLKVF